MFKYISAKTKKLLEKLNKKTDSEIDSQKTEQDSLACQKFYELSSCGQKAILIKDGVFRFVFVEGYNPYDYDEGFSYSTTSLKCVDSLTGVEIQGPLVMKDLIPTDELFTLNLIKSNFTFLQNLLNPNRLSNSWKPSLSCSLYHDSIVNGHLEIQLRKVGFLWKEKSNSDNLLRLMEHLSRNTRVSSVSGLNERLCVDTLVRVIIGFQQKGMQEITFEENRFLFKDHEEIVEFQQLMSKALL